MKSRYSRTTDPGPGEVEEEYFDELAGDSEINDGVLGAVESEGDEVLDGGEGKLGGDVADGLLVAPAKLVSTKKANSVVTNCGTCDESGFGFGWYSKRPS